MEVDDDCGGGKEEAGTEGVAVEPGVEGGSGAVEVVGDEDGEEGEEGE